MQYVANQCPNDGQYTIANSTGNCFGSTWLTVPSDHTGNPNGYFMLVNASYQPSDFFVQQVSGLCVGTTYQFAAWVLNMASHSGQILPNITFRIEKTDGTILQKFNTGDVPQYNYVHWNQYAFYFSTPPGVSTVVLRMINNAPGGIGNDLALDDITFRPAGPAISLSIFGQTGDTATICEGSTVPKTFSATIENCYSSAVYQWQKSVDTGRSWSDIAGQVRQTYSTLIPTPGIYLYRLTATQSGNLGIPSCKVASAPAAIITLKTPKPAVTISDSSSLVCASTPITFTARSTDGGNTPAYQWYVNGMLKGTGAPAFTTSRLADGDIVHCEMISDATCVVNPHAISNELTMTVIPAVTPGLQVSASATTICSDNTVTFTTTSSNAGDHPAYQWMDNNLPVGSGAPVYKASGLKDGDLITVTLRGSLPCSLPVTSTPFSMTVYPAPAISLVPDTIIAAGSHIRLVPVITGQIVSYQWSPETGLDNPGVADPMAFPLTTTTYALTVATQDGCTASAKENVGVFYGLKMPNAFSPNGDGRNDVFRVPPVVPVAVIHFSVYNRWGGLVFSAAGNNDGWDGRAGNKPQPAGAYVWIIAFYDPVLRKAVTQSGQVELIR